MSTTIVVVGAVGLLGAALLVGLVIWLVRSKTDEAVAEHETAALQKGKEKKRVADQIMAEPTAYEPLWIRRARARLGLPDDHDQP